MNIQQFVDEKLVAILDKYSVPGQEMGVSLKEAVLRSNSKELIIPVLGMQGMGKSTLINAILKEDIMPSEADETTCVPVEVKYGEVEQAEVYFSSDIKTKIVHTKNELYEYVDNNSNPGNEKQVSRIVLYRKNSLLEKGLTIVDLILAPNLTEHKISEVKTLILCSYGKDKTFGKVQDPGCSGFSPWRVERRHLPQVCNYNVRAV